jgi:hypothetical protein
VPANDNPHFNFRPVIDRARILAELYEKNAVQRARDCASRAFFSADMAGFRWWNGVIRALDEADLAQAEGRATAVR